MNRRDVIRCCNVSGDFSQERTRRNRDVDYSIADINKIVDLEQDVFNCGIRNDISRCARHITSSRGVAARGTHRMQALSRVPRVNGKILKWFGHEVSPEID